MALGSRPKWKSLAITFKCNKLCTANAKKTASHSEFQSATKPALRPVLKGVCLKKSGTPAKFDGLLSSSPLNGYNLEHSHGIRHTQRAFPHCQLPSPWQHLRPTDGPYGQVGEESLHWLHEFSASEPTNRGWCLEGVNPQEI